MLDFQVPPRFWSRRDTRRNSHKEETDTNEIHTEFEEENRWKKDPIKKAMVESNLNIFADYLALLFEKYGKNVKEEDEPAMPIQHIPDQINHSGPGASL